MFIQDKYCTCTHFIYIYIYLKNVRDHIITLYVHILYVIISNTYNMI